jgi:hypothetical protein
MASMKSWGEEGGVWRLSNSWVIGIYQDRRPMGWGCGQWLRPLVIQIFNSLVNACTEHEKTALGLMMASGMGRWTVVVVAPIIFKFVVYRL